MWKYSFCKCNVKWPPIKGKCRRLLGGLQGAKKKAWAETETGGMERTENTDGGFKCAYCCSCYVGGRSCSAYRQAPVCGTGGLAVQPRLQYQVSGRQNLSSLLGSNWWIAVAQISTEFNRVWGTWTLGEKGIFLIIPELSRNFGPRLPVYHKSRILLTHGVMLSCRHERQVEIFGASLLFGDFYKATTATFNGASSHVCPPRPQWYSCFQNRKKNESTMTSLCPWSNPCQLLATASWEAVFVLDKYCFVTVVVFL